MDGWAQAVKSMHAAIEDPSHVMYLGCGLGLIVLVWVNWRVARWIYRGVKASDSGD